MQTEGRELVGEVTAHRPPDGGVSFWWLGQLSVILKLGDIVMYLDPYLSPSERRLIPPLFAPEDVTNADWVLCTHDHRDHIDPGAIPGIARSSEQARFIAPHPVRERMVSLGVPAERLIGLDDGETFREGDLRITGVKSAHEFFDYVEGVGHPYMGYVVERGDCAVYHCGDTLCYEGLLTALQRWKLTVMFVPINGRDAVRYRRGTIGNMTYQEAVDLAGHAQPGLVVPGHWDMFAHNSEDPALFVDYLEAKFTGQAHRVCRPGERVDVGCGLERRQTQDVTTHLV